VSIFLERERDLFIVIKSAWFTPYYVAFLMVIIGTVNTFKDDDLVFPRKWYFWECQGFLICHYVL
jgi:hypothetical protein